MRSTPFAALAIGASLALAACMPARGPSPHAVSSPTLASTPTEAIEPVSAPGDAVTYSGASTFDHPSGWRVDAVVPNVWGFESYSLELPTRANDHAPYCDLTVDPSAVDGRVSMDARGLTTFFIKNLPRGVAGDVRVRQLAETDLAPDGPTARMTGTYRSTGGGETPASPRRYSLVVDLVNDDPSVPVFLMCAGPGELESEVLEIADMIARTFVLEP